MSKARPAGQPCDECEESVSMARVRVLQAEAAATGSRPRIRCVVCEGTVTVPASRPGDAEIVRQELAR